MSLDDQPQPAKGIAAALIGAAVLTAAAAVMPPAMRKLVLFAIAFGMGIGAICALVAGSFAMPRRLVLVLAPLLTIAGLSFIAQRTWREYQSLQRAADMADPQRGMPAPMLEAIAADDPGTAALLKRERSRKPPDFQQYLAVRTRPWGEWPRPWPALFWVGELILASAAGIIVAHRMLPARSVAAPPGAEIGEDTQTA